MITLAILAFCAPLPFTKPPVVLPGTYRVADRVIELRAEGGGEIRYRWGLTLAIDRWSVRRWGGAPYLGLMVSDPGTGQPCLSQHHLVKDLQRAKP